jgi:arylsulfatase A-like enzyme
MIRFRPCITVLAIVFLSAFATHAQSKKPNILVIFGDNIGQTNISAYSLGLMKYKTPNIDRIAHEGMMFTDYYAENSWTAGRSSFITGQSPKRTGLSKVGIPGAPVGLQPRDITIAQALKPLGYATGQFGKNHLGDKDEFLPTNHGFDDTLDFDVMKEFDFFGNSLTATPRKLIAHVLIHEIRHWAQVATFLRLGGVTDGYHDFLFSPVLGGELRRSDLPPRSSTTGSR